MLASGVTTLALAAVPALAACSTSTAGTTTTLDCSANTTTANTINNNPNNPATNSQRQQLNDNFVVKIGGGTAVSGFGLSIEPTGSNRTVAITNQGTVSTSQFDGVALNVSGNGGLVSYAGGGTVSGSFNGGGINGTGLNLTNTGSGDIQIGTAASHITAAFAGRVPISAFASGGNVSLFLSGGSLTTSLIGISLRNGSESSSINAVLTGNTTIVQAPGTSDATGIRVFFSGPVSVASDANMGTASKPLGQGISVNSDSTINIHQTGGTIYTDTRGIFNNTGIFASSDIATVTMDSNSRIVAYNGVVVSSSSLATVNVAGVIDSTGPAVVAAAGNGTANVTVSGTLTGNVGVQFFSSRAEAVNTGTITANNGIVSSAGPISVSNSGTIKGTAALGIGIDAVDDIKVTNNTGGKISGTAEGIYSRSASVFVTNSGSITAGQAGLSAGVAGLRGATVTNNAGGMISGGSIGVASLQSSLPLLILARLRLREILASAASGFTLGMARQSLTMPAALFQAHMESL
jgi:hypothetical protein